MKNLQKINSNHQSKYDEIIEYLKQDDGYWLENDKWDLTEKFFIGKKVYNSRYIEFSSFKNNFIKNEFKYYILLSYKEKFLTKETILNFSYRFKNLSCFIDLKYKEINSLYDLENKNNLINSWKLYLFNNNICSNDISTISLNIYLNSISSVVDFIKNFYDDREETEKDVWDCSKIQGIKRAATRYKNGGNKSLVFTQIPEFYRECVKNILELL